MEEKLLKEIKQIKQLLSALVGTTDLPKKEKFSAIAINKAANEFQKLAIARGDWISSRDFDTVFKDVRRGEKIIIEKFKFENYFKRGHTLYFNKTDLKALKAELKKKNINLKNYIDLLEDQEKFEKKVNSVKFTNSNKNHFKIPLDLEDINHTPPLPSIETIQNEINELLKEYKEFDLSEYISLEYKKTYAYFKYEYSFDRYVEPKKKKFCRDWCFKFNYAQKALKKVNILIRKGVDT